MLSVDQLEEFINDVFYELRLLEQPGYFIESEGFTSLYRRAKYASGRFKDISDQIASLKASIPVENAAHKRKEIERVKKICKKYDKIAERLQRVENTLEQMSFLEREKEKSVMLVNAKKESEHELKLRAQRELDYQRIKEMKKKRQAAKRAMEKEMERRNEEEKSGLGQLLKSGKGLDKLVKFHKFGDKFALSSSVFNRQSLRKLAKSYSLFKLYQHILQNNELSKCLKVTEIFLKLLKQIVKRPDDEKIRILRASNARFQESVVKVKGSLPCLLKIGFIDIVCEQSVLIGSGCSSSIEQKKELWYVMKVPSPIDDAYGWSNWMENIQQNIVFLKKMLEELNTGCVENKTNGDPMGITCS